MTTQRPFFYNFLAAFRAHSALKPPSAAPSTTSNSTTLSSAAAAYTTSTSIHHSDSNPTPSTQRIASQPHKPSTLVSAFSPSSTAAQHHTRKASATTPVSRTHGHTAGPALGTSSLGTPSSTARRRGSDSSSEGGCGFRDTMGGEKWFIGGRTGLGEERFYRLTMARRERSIDRVSLDRMSL